jgi:pimeloyl-ACP methyl ester carboxylesterase
VRLLPDDGAELAVEVDLPREPVTGWALLYAHGFGSSQSGEKATFFRRAAAEARIPFASLDFQGHGRSGGGMRGLTLSRNLDDLDRLHRLLAAEGFARVVAFGSSMGGVSVLWHAVRQPDTVAAAVALAPAITLADEMLRRAGLERAAEWEAAGFVHVSTDLVEDDLGWGFVEDFRRHPWPRLADDLTVPVLLFQGVQDESVPWRHVVELAGRSRQVDLHLFSDGDHRLIDRLPRLWSLTREFLAGHGLLA